MVSKNWYVYIARCQNNALYTGISVDVEKRIHTHNSGKGSKSCKAHGLPVKLVWQYETINRSSASMLEARIKKLTKIQKENLIKGRMELENA